MVAEADVVRIGERRRRQRLVDVDAEQRQVVARIGRHELGHDRLGVAGEAHPDLGRAGDDVGIRDDLTVLRHDDAGSDGLAGLEPTVDVGGDRHDARRHRGRDGVDVDRPVRIARARLVDGRFDVARRQGRRRPGRRGGGHDDVGVAVAVIVAAERQPRGGGSSGEDHERRDEGDQPATARPAGLGAPGRAGNGPGRGGWGWGRRGDRRSDGRLRRWGRQRTHASVLSRRSRRAGAGRDVLN